MQGNILPSTNNGLSNSHWIVFVLLPKLAKENNYVSPDMMIPPNYSIWQAGSVLEKPIALGEAYILPRCKTLNRDEQQKIIH